MAGAQASPPKLGLVLLALLAVAWGLNWPFMKIALAEIPPWTFRSWTCVAAGLLLLALAGVTGGRWRLAAGEWRQAFVASLFNVTFWHMLVAYGLIILESGKGSVLGFTMPLWAALLGVVFLKERLTGRRLLALVLGISGILILVSRDLATLGARPLGVAFLLAAAFGWAIGTIYQKRVAWTVSTLAVAGWQLLLGAIPILLVLPFVEGIVFPEASAIAWLCTLYLVLVALVFAYFAWFKIVRLFPTNVAAIGSLLTPVVGMVSGAVILGEPFGVKEVAALALVGSALALVLMVPAPAPRAVTADD